MRKTLLMAGALLALTSTVAFSSGTELAWNHCFGQAGALSMRTSACAANTGSQSMFASFRPPAGVNALVAVEVVIDYQVSGGVLPCWWNFAVGQLRSNQLTALPVSPTDVNGSPLVLCDNHYFLDHGAVGVGWMTVTGVDQGQLRGIAAIPAGKGLPVPADAQGYGVGFRIANGSTVPAASCDGCLQGACIILNSIKLTSLGLPDVVLESPHQGSSNYVTWQGNQAAVCPGIIPIRNATWGGIKSLYR